MPFASSSLPRSMSLLPQTNVFDHTLSALHAVKVIHAQTHTAILKAFAISLMTFGTPPRSIHFARIISDFQLLHGSPPNIQNVYIVTIVLTCLRPKCSRAWQLSQTYAREASGLSRSSFCRANRRSPCGNLGGCSVVRDDLELQCHV